MAEYTELIKALRHCSEDDDACATCQRWIAHDEWGIKCKGRLISDAAAAIEALQAEVDALKHDIERYMQINTELLNEPLQVGKAGNKYTLNEPKRGEWEREMDVNDEPFYQCSVCGECFDFNSDSTHEVFNYCPNCGAKMMEVQDGQE